MDGNDSGTPKKMCPAPISIWTRHARTDDCDGRSASISSFLEKSARRARVWLRQPRPLHLANLCDMCELIFEFQIHSYFKTYNFAGWYKHHPSRTALNKASELGCVICKRLMESLSELRLNTRPEQDSFSAKPFDLRWIVFHTESAPECFLQISFADDYLGTEKPLLHWTLLNGTLPGSLEGISFSLNQHGKIALPATILDKELSPWATCWGQRWRWDFCRFWLHNCRTLHHKCSHREQRTPFRPSRLVLVQRNATDTITARVACTSISDAAVEYLTLSHCWGTTKFFTLVEQNLGQLQKDIVVGNSPKAFQDAFAVTLELGFSYIWIDSLCIVQDSQDDWLRESSQMGDIYKNCSCNIAATSSAKRFL